MLFEMAFSSRIESVGAWLQVGIAASAMVTTFYLNDLRMDRFQATIEATADGASFRSLQRCPTILPTRIVPNAFS